MPSPTSVSCPETGCPNIVFLKHNDAQGTPVWSPTDEHDNPIWGWVAINHVNASVQLFLPDASLYREVRRSESSGSQTERRPLDRDLEERRDVHQLLLLSQRLADAEFLDSFSNMIVQATRDTLPDPNAHASFASSLITRPLALAHVGFSFGLAADEMVNESSDSQLKLSGMVGYFPSRNSLGGGSQALDLGLDLTTIRSQCAPDGSTPAIIKPPQIKITAGKTEQEVYGMLLDPLVPLHVHSGDTPVRQLIMPSWMWQGTTEGIEEFSQSGPLILTRDLPKAAVERELAQDGVVPPQKNDSTTAVALPPAGGADWAWLKPYVSVADEAMVGEASEGPSDRFMPLQPRTQDEVPKFEEGPFTGLEGYLMMRKRDGNSNS